MLRSVLTRTSLSLVGRSRSVVSHAVHQNPSTTTSVLLNRLPISVVESDLKKALEPLNCRRVEFEPGCSLLFVNECEAKVAAKKIESNFNTKSVISRVSMPSLLLQNIPDGVSADALTKAFTAQNPKSIHITGRNTLRVTLSTSRDALTAMTALHKVHIDGHTLRVTGTKIREGEHVLSIFNFPDSQSIESVVNQVTTALDSVNITGHSAVEMVTQSLTSKKSVMLRYDDDLAKEFDPEILQAALDKNHPGAFKVASFGIKKPALFLRNLDRLERETQETMLEEHKAGIERIQWLSPGEDLDPHMAVVYFKSEEAAFAAMKYLHNTEFNGAKISVAYREAAEPGVLVTDLSERTKAESLVKYCRPHHVVRCEFITNTRDNTRSARLIVPSPRDAKYLAMHLNEKHFKGSKINAAVVEATDLAVKITPTHGADLTPSMLAEALGGFAQPKSVTYQTNTNAHIGFLSVQEAQRALERFNRGDVQLPSSNTSSSSEPAGSLVGSSISALPAFALQVQGLGLDMPVRSVTEHLAAELPDVRVIKADRSALLKFRRNGDVAPGLQQLKELHVNGQHVKAARYRPLEIEGDSAYDTIKGPKEQKQADFDRLNVLSLVKDFMHLDPATRYQIAKNQFHRKLYEARGVANLEDEEEETDDEVEEAADDKTAGGEVSDDEDGPESIYEMFAANFTGVAQQEIYDLFYQVGSAAKLSAGECETRLFRYYLQTQEMQKYSSDFREIEAIHGVANENEYANWAIPYNSVRMEELYAEIRQAEEQARLELLEATKGRAAKALQRFETKVDKYFDPAVGFIGDSDSDSDGMGSDSHSEDEFDIAGMSSGSDSSDFDTKKKSRKASRGSDSSSDSDRSSGSDSDSSGSSSSDFSGSEFDDYGEEFSKEDKKLLAEFKAKHTYEESDGEGGVRKVFRNPVRAKRHQDEQGNALNVVERNGEFVDESGSVWAMMIIDTDTVQKTLAGGRFVSHRALVVMGNLKGSAGFGMGKGKDPPSALTAACRAALRNLVHIDLYDNFGLAHDLYGKHNACHCIIRATPKSREMVASPLVEEILNRIGIVSASVKIIGNRNPYSVMNALFNALSKHQNIDEMAKARGKRYLTVRWARDQNL